MIRPRLSPEDVETIYLALAWVLASLHFDPDDENDQEMRSRMAELLLRFEEMIPDA